MANEEIIFLRDQVKRLNAALAQYQEKYPPLTLPTDKLIPPLNSEGPAAPWLVEKSLLSPLLLEYDANIKSLTEELEMYKSDHNSLRQQIEKLVAENRRLATDMKDVVQTQLESFSGVELTPATGDDHMLKNLQQQLSIALQEKQAQAEMSHSAVHEVERLENELREQKSHPQWKLFEQQANQIKEQYFNAVSSLNTEISKLQDELRKSKNENRTAVLQVNELRKTLEEMKDGLKNMERHRDDLLAHCSTNDAEMAEVKTVLTETQHKLQVIQRNFNDEQKNHLTAETMINELQKKCTELEQREYDAVIQARDDAQIVENAMFEKDQCLISDKQKEEEIQKLQDAINKLLDEAGVRTREEVENVRKQYNNNIERLTEEVYTLEMENTEKQVQLDRVIREKKALENELENVYREGIVKGSKEAGVFDELNSRMCLAEQERDEIKLKSHSLETNLKRVEMTQKKEKSFFETENNTLKDKISSLNQEFENANNDRMKYLDQVDGLKRKLIEVQKDKEATQRKFHKELSCLEQDKVLKEREYEVRIQSTDEANRHGMLELRKLLTSHQRMSAKWKEECQTITQKFEQKVTDLRTETSRMKARNKELVSLLQESQEKTRESEVMLSEYTKNIKKLEDRVRDSEQRSAAAAKEISIKMARERKVNGDRQRNLRNSQLASFETRLGESLAPSNAME